MLFVQREPSRPQLPGNMKLNTTREKKLLPTFSRKFSLSNHHTMLTCSAECETDIFREAFISRVPGVNLTKQARICVQIVHCVRPH